VSGENLLQVTVCSLRHVGAIHVCERLAEIEQAILRAHTSKSSQVSTVLSSGYLYFHPRLQMVGPVAQSV